LALGSPYGRTERETSLLWRYYGLNWLSATGTSLLLTGIVSGLLLGFSLAELGKILDRTLRRVKWSLLTIAAMLSRPSGRIAACGPCCRSSARSEESGGSACRSLDRPFGDCQAFCLDQSLELRAPPGAGSVLQLYSSDFFPWYGGRRPSVQASHLSLLA
jgi:hypothetical protein